MTPQPQGLSREEAKKLLWDYCHARHHYFTSQSAGVHVESSRVEFAAVEDRILALLPGDTKDPALPPYFPGLADKIAAELTAISAQREDLVKAFIAQHGFNPDEAEQVIQHTEAGTVFFIRKRPTPLPESKGQ